MRTRVKSRALPLAYLVCEIMVFLSLLRFQGIPPFTKYFADRPVVLVRVLLMHKLPVAFGEYHKRVHWSPYVPFCLQKNQSRYSLTETAHPYSDTPSSSSHRHPPPQKAHLSIRKITVISTTKHGQIFVTIATFTH